MLTKLSRRSVPAILLILWTAVASADPPSGYYDSVDATTSARLRATLHPVIDDHLRRPYTSDGIDTVRDTQTGSVKTYENPAGTPFQPIQDTKALATCSGTAAR